MRIKRSLSREKPNLKKGTKRKRKKKKKRERRGGKKKRIDKVAGELKSRGQPDGKRNKLEDKRT